MEGKKKNEQTKSSNFIAQDQEGISYYKKKVKIDVIFLMEFFSFPFGLHAISGPQLFFNSLRGSF